jgi:lipopolysaccharide cholinephosphotransferase
MEGFEPLWRLQKEMASVLVDVCKRHDLRIWAGYGTLLGCARHQGFIPWDDDMDFVMMRDDYDHLRALIASGTSLIPTGSPVSFDIDRQDVIKLRYANTAMVLPKFKYTDAINQSVWVDVFSMESIPENVAHYEKAYSRLRRLLRIEANAMQMSYGTSKGIVGTVWHLYCNLYVKIRPRHKIQEEVNAILQSLKTNSSTLIANILLYSRTSKYKTLSKIKKYDLRWFNETVYLPFDDMKLPCPAEYEKVLEAEYGDWRTPVKGASLHGMAIVDLNRSYKEVIEERLAAIPKFKRFFYVH